MCQLSYFLCAISCLLGITGCVTTPYPDNWPRAGAASAMPCANLTGSFENYGHCASCGNTPLLAKIFFAVGPGESRGRYYELQAISHLTIDDWRDDGLEVKAWVGDELLMERRLPASQLSCHQGRHVYHDTEWGLESGSIGAVTHSSYDYLISLAADGSLVLEGKAFSVGVVFMVVPLAVKSQDWFLFPRTSPNPLGIQAGRSNPRGVRSGKAPAYSLLLPENAAKWSGHRDATACLDWVQAGAGEPPDPQALGMLGGRSTQAFIIQNGRDGALVPAGKAHASMGWVPATHELQIEKQHWLPPSLSDRYVICLLGKGYRWENDGK